MFRYFTNNVLGQVSSFEDSFYVPGNSYRIEDIFITLISTQSDDYLYKKHRAKYNQHDLHRYLTEIKFYLKVCKLKCIKFIIN